MRPPWRIMWLPFILQKKTCSRSSYAQSSRFPTSLCPKMTRQIGTRWCCFLLPEVTATGITRFIFPFLMIPTTAG
ncbi:hypothetical protein FPV67DRAFT_1464353 [Lyophyllum atratum]|nr:hypothetical protein FPV67DRAFT_1464353 [Lyophyllum atratum]